METASPTMADGIVTEKKGLSRQLTTKELIGILLAVVVAVLVTVVFWQNEEQMEQKALVAGMQKAHAEEIRGYQAQINALTSSGPFGKDCTVPLPGGKIAIAGGFLEPAALAGHYYCVTELVDGAIMDMVYRVDQNGGATTVVMARPGHSVAVKSSSSKANVPITGKKVPKTRKK